MFIYKNEAGDIEIKIFPEELEITSASDIARTITKELTSMRPWNDKLVSKLLWNIIDRKYNYIAKCQDGDIRVYQFAPIRCGDKWSDYGQMSHSISDFIDMKNHFISQVNWKESLCRRPKEKNNS